MPSKLRSAALGWMTGLRRASFPRSFSLPERQAPDPGQDVVRDIPPIGLALHVVAHAGKYSHLGPHVSRCAPHFTRRDDVIAFGTPELERAWRRLLIGDSGKQGLTERKW